MIRPGAAVRVMNVSRLTNARCRACAQLHATHYSVDANTPRNLFEVYCKNKHWMGVYQRNPVVKTRLRSVELKEQVEMEKRKQIDVSLDNVIDPSSAVWEKGTVRVGAIGRKIGSTNLWTTNGFRHTVTLIQIKDCHVIDTQISRSDGGIDVVTQMIVGCEDVHDEQVLAKMPRDHIQWFLDRGSFPKQFWTGFPVTKNSLLPPGTEITASHYQPGRYVKVKGITIERGIQGVMKRWGMKGQPASHGQTKTHRKMGATGGGQDPGRIFPGKKMAGNVGGTFSTTPPLRIMRVNTKFNVLYVRGGVPGEIGGFLKIKDSRRKEPMGEPSFYPTHFRDIDPILDEDLYADDVFSCKDPSLRFDPHV